MSSLVGSRWFSVAPLVAALTYVVVVGVIDRSWFGLAVMAPLLAVVGWWAWPARRGRHTAHAAVRATTQPSDVIVYWRPG